MSSSGHTPDAGGAAGSRRRTKPRARKKLNANEGRTTAEGDRARERILDAASAIASRRGYEGTAMSVVSEQSGYSPSSIYWHFGNKDGLLAAVLERGWSDWYGTVPQWEDGEGSPEERTEEWLRGVARSLVEQTEFLRFGLLVSLETRDRGEVGAKAAFLSVHLDAIERFERSLVAAREAQGLDTSPKLARHLATCFIAFLNGAFLERFINLSFSDVEGAIATFKHVLLHPHI